MALFSLYSLWHYGSLWNCLVIWNMTNFWRRNLHCKIILCWIVNLHQQLIFRSHLRFTATEKHMGLLFFSIIGLLCLQNLLLTKLSLQSFFLMGPCFKERIAVPFEVDYSTWLHSNSTAAQCVTVISYIAVYSK